MILTVSVFYCRKAEYKNIEKPLDFLERVCYNKNEPVIFLTKINLQ